MLFNIKKVRLLQFLYGLYFAIACYLTYISSPPTNTLTGWIKVGQIFGVLTLSALGLQLLLSSRLKVLEKGIGLDRIMRWHRLNGMLTALFVFLHPAFINIPLLMTGIDPLKFLLSYTIWHYLGISAFLLLFFTIAFTIYSKRKNLDYEKWKIIHKVGYIIIVLGFVHSLMLGSDLVTASPLRYWWWFVLAISIASVIHRYVVRPIKFKESVYEVVKVEKVTPDVTNVEVRSQSGEPLKYSPGQFAFVTFDSENVEPEEHHFTLSSNPNDSDVSFTVKGVGDFTGTLPDLQPGDIAKIEGPYGVFSNEGMEGPFVFIAGGIGITPIMSMLRAMRERNNPQKTLLLYANRKQKDIVFYDELHELQKQGWLEIVFVLSQEKLEGYEYGRINKELLQRVVEDIPSKTYFMVGPEAMMDDIEEGLVTLGAHSNRIFTERFALR